MTRPLQRSLLLAALLALPGATAWSQAAAPAAPAGPVSRPVYSTLPDLGSSANAAISRAEEYQVGRLMMRDLRSQNALLDDVETADYLQALGARIAAETQQGEQRLTFFAVRDRSINAFALPGGFVGFHTGLILLTDSEAELAGVVAHEVGHVVQRHIARAVQAQGRINITSLAGMLAGVLIGAATGNAEAIPGILAISQGTAMQQQINFTRMEEHEADRVGIGFLAAAGFDPNGMAGFFTTLMRQRGLAGSDIPSLLLTHPVDTVRLAEARARIASMPEMPRRPESVSYAYIRERLRVLTASTGSDLRRHYERERAVQPANGALRYGAALVETQSGNAAAAIALLKPLIAEQPQLPLLQAALAQAQLAAGQQQEGIASFEQGLVLSPRNVPLTVRYAEALLVMDQAKKSHQLLLDLFNNVAPTPEQIRLIARAASAAGDAGDAYAYMAELHLANGELPLAVNQLDLALAAPGLTDVQRKRFRARRDEVRDALRDSRGRGERGGPRDGPQDDTRDDPRDTSRDGPRSRRS
jgi:predicted Zn-dependent protease